MLKEFNLKINKPNIHRDQLFGLFLFIVDKHNCCQPQKENPLISPTTSRVIPTMLKSNWHT